MRKRLLTFILLLVAGIAANAQRYDFSAISPSGDTLYYKINSDSSSVTVVSPSPNYWLTMTGYVHAYHVIIPSFATDSSDSTTYVVRAVGDSAYYYCVYLSSVVIGDSIRTIGNYAFSTTTWLSSVTLGSSVTWIGACAFMGSNLSSVTIPESVTYLGASAFKTSSLSTVNFNAINCTYAGYYVGYSWFMANSPFSSHINGSTSGNNSVNTVNIGTAVRSIPPCLFANCSAIHTVIIPDSVLYIGPYAFDHCTSLYSISVSNSVTSINDYTFNGCWGLTSVSMGNSVTTIGSHAFSDCSSLPSIEIPNSVTAIGTYAFMGCNSLDSLLIPNSVTSIGQSAFSGCGNLTSVSLPSSITSIANDVFYYCHKLRSIVIPDSVTTIGIGAFQGCDSMRYVTIGSSVSQIGVSAFGLGNNGISRIERITVLCTVPPTLSVSSTSPFHTTFDITSISGIPVYVPCGTLSAYSSAIEWNQFTNIQEPTDCTSHYWDFHRVTALGSSVYYKILDDSVSVAVVHPLASDSIDDTYWHGYRRTAGTLEIPDTVVNDSVAYVVRVIGSHAFEGCTGLSSVTIPATVDSIGNSAFAGCTGINTVYFNADSCRYMGEADSLVFGGDRWLHTLHIGNNVRSVPDYAFEHLLGLQSIVIPDSVVSVGDWSFAYDANVTELTLGASLEHIGVGAFYGCGRLRHVVMPPSTPPSGGGTSGGGTWIGGGAFGGCGFGSFTYGGTTISPGLFSGNTSLDTVYISDTVTTIGDSAFNGCTGLTTVVEDGYTGIPEAWIPRTVRAVGNVAFGNCIALTRVRYEADSCLRMGSDTLPVFMNDSNIATLEIGEYVRWIPDYAFLGCTGLESITANGMEAPVLGVDVFSDVADSIPVYIPCGSLASYTLRWSYFTNFVEMPFEDTIIVRTADSTMGVATVLTQPSCSNARMAEIVATANYGYHFVAWSDGDTANPRTIVVTHDVVLTALFDRNQYTLTLVCDEAQGMVMGAGTYLYGDTATVTVVANEGYGFSRWAETGSTELAFDTVIGGDVVLTALFDTLLYTLTLESNNPEWGSVIGGGEYAYGSEVEITATANEGYHFVRWSDGVTENPRVVVLLEDMELTAVFAEGVGIETVENAMVRLYPNPTIGVLNIEAQEVQRVEVYDLDGRVVIRSERTNTIDLKALPLGVYYVKVICQQGTTVHKVVKK